MPLESLILDDLTWSELTTTARNRIAGASAGEWTLHAPVDPGVTLLELFASQLEQRLYWLNQPSDEFSEALLRLLGVEQRPVQCAKTILSFRPPEIGQSACPHLAKHVVTQKTQDTPRRFRTCQSINVAGWPRAIARPGLPRIRTCPH